MTPSRVDGRVPVASVERTRWVVPLLLCVAVLLVAGLAYNLAHLDTGGEVLPPTPGAGSPAPNFWGLFEPNIVTEILLSAFLVFLIGGVVYIVLHRRTDRERPMVRPAGWRNFLATIVSMIIFALLVYLWPRIARSVAGQASPNGSGANATANATTIPTVAGIPLGVFLGAALLLSVLVVALVLQGSASLRRMAPPTPLADRRLAAVRAVDDAISDLEFGADIRAAIVACYHRFCLLLGARGIADQEPLTPRELEGLAITQLAVSSESAESLTSLFEEARYSTHTLGEPDRDHAIESLARIRVALEG
jgi:hypothetical protein